MLVCEVSLGRAFQAKTHNLHGQPCPVPGFDSTEGLVRESSKVDTIADDVSFFQLPPAHGYLARAVRRPATVAYAARYDTSRTDARMFPNT